MKRILLALSLLAALSPLSGAQPSQYKVDPAHSSIIFNIRHLVSQVEGRFREFEGNITLDPKDPAKCAVDFTVKANSIFTDNEKRDNHLKGDDFFAVEKFPTLTFKSKRVAPRGPNKYDVLGTMTIRGVSKEMLIPVNLLGVGKGFQGEVAGFRSDFSLNRKDFGIVWNTNVDKGGAVLGDEVQVRLLVEAGKQ